MAQSHIDGDDAASRIEERTPTPLETVQPSDVQSEIQSPIEDPGHDRASTTLANEDYDAIRLLEKEVKDRLLAVRGADSHEQWGVVVDQVDRAVLDTACASIGGWEVDQLVNGSESLKTFLKASGLLFSTNYRTITTGARKARNRRVAQ
ncbi:unnamed protein product [Zymoseptoria tritici ST99CH_3D1]|nr:unnamed protein product [Zymoseptoria tritici ST99CH_3D1]